MDLKSVYNLIAESWAELKTVPFGFVVDFLAGKSGSLLVVGCGSGRHSVFASKNGLIVTGFDFSFKMIELVKQKDPVSHYLVADACSIPFIDGLFDYSLCVAVLHHLRPSEILIALKELKRVTKGQSLVSVWNHPSFRGEHLVKWGDQERFYYLYEREEFIDLIKQVFNKVTQVPDEQNFVFIVE